MSPSNPRTPSRGPALPPGVYWRRRLFATGVALALVLIVVNALRGPDPGPAVQARPASAEESDAAVAPVAASGPTTQARVKKHGRKGARSTTETTPPSVVLPAAPVLLEPEGECAQDDLLVTPTVTDAVAGRSATIVLKLRTLTSPACTWQVSADTLAVRVSVGDDEVWASRECPATLGDRAVVVRQAVASTYELTWNTRRSDELCPGLTEYAQPGDYRVTAAALGGEAADVIFTLPAPQAPAPTPTPKPEAKPKAKARPDAEKMPSTRGRKTNSG